MFLRRALLRSAILVVLASVSFSALFAFQSRLVDADGKPVAGAQISIVDQRGSVRTDSDGRFEITPDPEFPATLIVVGSRGELYPPVYLERMSAEVRLLPSYRETVTVTIGATPNIEGTPAAAPVVYGTEDLEERKPVHVAEAIAETPGVALRGEGPPAVPVIRGLAGGRTLLLIDDARIVAERRAGPSATFVDPISLGSIEISRGPGSVAYGSDALGGVVHLRPRDPVPGAPSYRYDLWSTFGAENARSAAAEVSADAFGGAILASFHARAAEEAEDASGDVIANSQYRDRGALFRFVRDSAWGRVRTGLMSSVARDVGAPASGNDRTTYPDERATLATLALDLNEPGGWTAASLRASLGSYAITTTRTRPAGVESAAIKARDASVRFSGEKSGRRSRFVTGVDVVSRFNLRAEGSIDDADRFDTGLFASWSSGIAPMLQLAAGGRADHIITRNAGGYFGDRSRNDTALSGFGAMTAGPFRGFTTTLQVASGYREPSLSDRYYRGVSGRGFITGNPELDPERSLQFDAGVSWSASRSRVALYAYDYRIRNLVERYRSGSDFVFRNRGEAEVRGAELDAAAHLPRNFELRFGASIARGEDRASGDALDDIAPPTFLTSLRWAVARASLFTSVSTFLRDDRPGPVEVDRPGFTTIDAGAGWRVSDSLELRVIVRNVGDVQHYGSADEAAAFAPGRSITIGINR